eukprot:3250123-Prorocentrum_lima.AAC.1
MEDADDGAGAGNGQEDEPEGAQARPSADGGVGLDAGEAREPIVEGLGDSLLQEELEDLTREELRDELKARGLAVTGRKTDLRKRLNECLSPESAKGS